MIHCKFRGDDETPCWRTIPTLGLEFQLTRDAVATFQGVPLSQSRIYYWPLAQRERNASGRPGKLHVKCAIVDNVAIIGSGNTTDDAFNRNMELGMLVREEGIVLALAERFDELIRRGVLVWCDTRSMTA